MTFVVCVGKASGDIWSARLFRGELVEGFQ